MKPISKAILGDCMEAMKDTPGKYYDLAICENNQTPSKEFFNELFRVSKNQIIFGANCFTGNLPNSMGLIFWDKTIGGDFSDVELIFTSFEKDFRKFTCHPFVGTNSKERITPTQKPIKLYKWLLTNYAKQGDIILDTHGGSFSSRIAAYDLGFDFYGWELDKEYFNAAEQRFANHIAQGNLFAPPDKAEVIQENLF